jgi:hypothetical protein
MTGLARSYLREAVSSYGVERANALYEGMKHYTDELMEVVNAAHPSDLPMVLAAMDTVEETVRELPEYKKKKYATVAEEMCRQLAPVVTRQRVEIRVAEDMYELPGEDMRGF